MKKYLLLQALCLWLNSSLMAQMRTRETIEQFIRDERGQMVLLGACDRDALKMPPFQEWFSTNYAAYTLDSITCNQIRPLLAGRQFTLFLGTWCGDSRRVVPALLKIFDCCNLQPEQIRLIMLGNGDTWYKKSPQREEAGQNIIRVPTLIVRDGGREIGRLVEYPVRTLELDLLAILKGDPYQPRYAHVAGGSGQ